MWVDQHLNGWKPGLRFAGDYSDLEGALADLYLMYFAPQTSMVNSTIVLQNW